MMPNSLYAGIDVGLRVNRVSLGDWKGEKVAPDASVANDAYGVQALAQSFSQTATKLGCDSLIIGLEATSLYSWHLAWVLSWPPAWPASASLRSRSKRWTSKSSGNLLQSAIRFFRCLAWAVSLPPGSALRLATSPALPPRPPWPSTPG